NNQFALNGSTGNGNYTIGGSWTTSILITSVHHGLITGEKVLITGALGNTAANGTWTVTVIDDDHFTLDGSTGNGAYTGGGTWTRNTPVVVESGAALELGASAPLANGGIQRGLQVWYSQLVLNGTGNSLFGDAPLTSEAG